MNLFIFESIGAQELILIGMISLIAFEPHRLPEISKKVTKFIGKIRILSNEYIPTWEREVASFELDKELKKGENNNCILLD